MLAMSAAPKRFVASVVKVGRRRSNGLSKSCAWLPQAQFSTSKKDCQKQFTLETDSSRVARFSTMAAIKVDPNVEEIHNELVKERGFGEKVSTRNKVTPRILQELPLVGPRSSEWWTGKAPVIGQCPGLSTEGVLHSLPLLSLQPGATTRASIQDYFDNTWALTEALFASLQGEEAFIKAPIHDLRHPLIFYYGHPAVLYINKLRLAGLIQHPINPYFEAVFETGVDEMSWDDLSKNKMQWPSVKEVHAYRKQAYATVSHVISNLTDEECSNVNRDSPLWALMMSFEHERIHIETSSVLITELPSQYLSFPHGLLPPYHPSIPTAEAATSKPQAGRDFPVNQLIPVAAQAVTLGRPAQAASYGWDNEYGNKTVNIPPFTASKFKISNGEFLEFVVDGGYSRPELWTAKGWEWRAFRNAKWPTFWQLNGPQGLHQYKLRALCDVVDMPWSWPVAVNYHEAKAFANWKTLKQGGDSKFRVMTELEHHAIRDHQQKSDAQTGADPVLRSPETQQLNANMRFSSMSPVDAFPANSQGFYDVMGNAWEWTEDYFSALPGFQVHKFYEDFSTPCFDGLHHVIMGSSFVSTGNEASIYSRYHFRPHFHQHASFRLVQVDSGAEMVTSDQDAPGPFVGSYPFRRSREGMLQAMSAGDHSVKHTNSRLLKHFVPLTVSGLKGLASPIQSLKDIVLQAMRQQQMSVTSANILEIGCGPGGLCFELAASGARTVMGIDHSFEDMETANSLLAGREVLYELRGEGSAVQHRPVQLPSSSFDPSAVSFKMADPMCVPAELANFHLVLLSDVIDKISSPNSLLGRLGGARGLVRSGGLLVISSAYQWSEDITPKSLWLGGPAGQGRGESGAEALAARLDDDFECLSQLVVPQLWQESASELAGKIVNVTVLLRK